MKDLSDIFYPQRNAHHDMVHKFVPDRTIDTKRLTVIFFQPRKEDHQVAITGWNCPRDKKIVESLNQLREVSDLLGIAVADIPLRYNNNLSVQIKNKGIHSGQVLFLAITQPETNLFQEIGYLHNLGFQIIIGDCGSEVSAGWSRFLETESRYGGFTKPDLERIKIVDALEFADVLLWEEFRLCFRSARLGYLVLPFINDFMIPCLRQLKIRGPQLRLHFREGFNGKYVREFALETDWEPNDESKVRVVFRKPIYEEPKSLRERFLKRFQKSETVFRFAHTERDYICLSITKEHDIGCFFTTISKNSKMTIVEILNEKKRIEKKSKAAADEFIKQNTEAALIIGVIPKWNHFKNFYEIHPYRKLGIQECGHEQIREALKTSIEMIGMREQSILNPSAIFFTNELALRLYRQETTNGTTREIGR